MFYFFAEALFIGDLDQSVTEQQLREVFKNYGPLTNIVIKKDKRTQNSLGYGFIYFATIQQKELVLANKDSFVCYFFVTKFLHMPYDIYSILILDLLKLVRLLETPVYAFVEFHQVSNKINSEPCLSRMELSVRLITIQLNIQPLLNSLIVLVHLPQNYAMLTSLILAQTPS